MGFNTVFSLGLMSRGVSNQLNEDLVKEREDISRMTRGK
jgi:hypothetical protein